MAVCSCSSCAVCPCSPASGIPACCFTASISSFFSATAPSPAVSTGSTSGQTGRGFTTPWPWPPGFAPSCAATPLPSPCSNCATMCRAGGGAPSRRFSPSPCSACSRWPSITTPWASPGPFSVCSSSSAPPPAPSSWPFAGWATPDFSAPASSPSSSG